MKCFNHNYRDAFSIDPITGKGLCLECLEDYKGYKIEKNSEISKIGVTYQTRMRKYDKKIGIANILSSVLMIFYSLYFFVCNYFFTEERSMYYCFITSLVTIIIIFYFLQILKFYFKKER